MIRLRDRLKKQDVQKKRGGRIHMRKEITRECAVKLLMGIHIQRG